MRFSVNIWISVGWSSGTRKLGIKYCYNGSRAVRMYYHHSKSWGYYTAAAATRVMVDPLERVAKLASENAVVIFSLGSCCMCHAVERLFRGMGVNLTVYELDQDPRGKKMSRMIRMS